MLWLLKCLHSSQCDACMYTKASILVSKVCGSSSSSSSSRWSGALIFIKVGIFIGKCGFVLLREARTHTNRRRIDRCVFFLPSDEWEHRVGEVPGSRCLDQRRKITFLVLHITELSRGQRSELVCWDNNLVVNYERGHTCTCPWRGWRSTGIYDGLHGSVVTNQKEGEEAGSL